MMVTQDISAPDHVRKNNMELKLGPGDRTQVLEHNHPARLPAELAWLVVQAISNKHYMVKTKILILLRAKFELASHEAPHHHLPRCLRRFRQKTFTYGHRRRYNPMHLQNSVQA